MGKSSQEPAVENGFSDIETGLQKRGLEERLNEHPELRARI